MPAMRRGLLVGGVAAVGVGLTAWAGKPLIMAFFQEDLAPVFTSDGLAIRGYDPVAYFRQAQPVAGSQEHEAVWKGAVWRFASAENKAAFEADPERFAPQYGGFCAWAVAAKSELYSTQPDNWSIVDGKLYLNFNDDVQERWSADPAGFIERGDLNWPQIQSKG